MPIIPYTPDEIRERSQDPNFPLSLQHAAILYDEEEKKPFGQKVSDFGSGLKAGAGHVVDTTVKGAKEAWNSGSLPKVGASAVEGVARGTVDLVDLAKQAGRKLSDVAFEQIGDSNRDQKIQNYYNRLQAQRTQARRPNAQVIDALAPYTLSNTAEAVGNLADASSFIPAVAPIKFAGKGAKLAEAGAKAGARTLEGSGKVLNAVAKAPRAAVDKVVEKVAGPEAAAKTDKVLRGAQTMLSGTALVGSPVGAVSAGIQTAEKVGQGLEKAGQLAGHIAGTRGVSLGDKFKRLRADPTAPQWMRIVASTAASPLGKAALGAATVTGDVAKGAAHGAAIGGALGAATAENASELGQAVGAGATLGAQGRAITQPIQSKFRELRSRAIDLDAFSKDQMAKGATPELLKQIDDDTALRIAQAMRTLEGRTDIRIVDGKTFDAQFPAAKGANGAHDGKTIWLAPERTRNTEETFLHEFLHATLANDVSRRPELRTEIRASLEEANPGQVEASIENLKRDYAAKLVGRDPAKQAGWIEQKSNESAQRNEGDRDAWLYEEIYADAGSRLLHGRNVEKSFGWMADRMDSVKRFLTLFSGNPEAVNKALFNKTPSEIFNSPEFASVYKSPGLRKLVNQIVRDRQQFLTGVSRTPIKDAGMVITKDMAGNHPAFPLRDNSDAQGRRGNDFVYVGSDGNVHPRTAAEIKKADRVKAASVEEAINAEGPKPVAPLNDPDPVVKLRKTISDKVLRTGTVLPDWFYNLPTFGNETKGFAKLFETLIPSGETAKFYYFAAGTGRGQVYAESVRRAKGALTASEREALPLGFTITKTGELDIAGKPTKVGGNVLVVALDLTSANKKAVRWRAEGKLDTLWGGDAAAFLTDLRTYIKNHAEGKPGADGLGDQKRDTLNALVIGGNQTHADKNVFRTLLRGEDKGGIVRTFRLDRIENVTPTGDKMGAGNYDKKVLNLSPDTTVKDSLTPDTSPAPERLSPVEKPEVDLQADNGHLMGPTMFSVRAYHGTPHTVDKFSTDKIGTGEGAQVYGWGLYFAENKNVAQSYQKGLTEKDFIRKVRELYDENSHPSEAEAALKELAPQLSEGQLALLEALEKEGWWGFDYPHQAVQAAIREPQNFDPGPATKAALEKFGNLYSVELNAEPHELLDWDAPLSEQPEQVRNSLASVIPEIKRDNYEPRGSDLYGDISRKHMNPIPPDDGWTSMAVVQHRGDGIVGNERKASEFLRSLGIKGIRYKDQGSRISAQDTKRLNDLRKEVAELRQTIQRNEGRPWAERKMFTDWLSASERDLAVAEKDAAKPQTYNYVIFNGDDIKILERNGSPVEQPVAQ